MTSGVSIELGGTNSSRAHARVCNYNDIIVIFIKKNSSPSTVFDVDTATFLRGNHILRLKSELLSDDDIFSAGWQIHNDSVTVFLHAGSILFIST